MNGEIRELDCSELDCCVGGVAPMAIVFAVYTFATPIFAAGVAVGVQEAVEAQT